MQLTCVKSKLTPVRHGRRALASLCAGAVIVAALTVSVVSLALAATSFPDVPTTHPYFTAITDLATRTIITGFPNGNFGPDDPVSRQQFAKMIVLTGGYPVSESDVCPFLDVVKSDATSFYPDNYIAVCAAHGITTGKTATMFDPYSGITRYQALTMVVRAADDLQPGLLTAPPTGWTGTAGWENDGTHGANAARAEYNGLLAGLDLTVSPYGNMTRGEVAQVLHNLLGKLAPPVTTTTSAATTTTTLATTTTSSTTTTSASSTTTSVPASTTTTTAVSQPPTDYSVAGLENTQVVITVRDQFGNPLPNIEVHLTSVALEGSGLALFNDFNIGTTDGNGNVAWTWGQTSGDWGVERVTAWVDNNTIDGLTWDVAIVQWILDDTGTDTIAAVNGQQKVTVISGYAPWNGKTLKAHLAPLGIVLGSGTYVSSVALSLSTALHTWTSGQVFFIAATSSNIDGAPNWMYNIVP
ncbi:MAG: hypothetical protein A2133_01125 [Actinobacteria bacterium RBG_16_64_13]|nr:MAG: hypothetical protein A2133_01125 [Actinobacteria bacterium RBG_16_64_13]